MRKLDVAGIFKSEAGDLRKTREDSIRIHGTGDIKAAGNEVEEHVREMFRRMLPKNIYVTHGHLIDQNGSVSPQLDIIIADSSNLPSLMTTKDGTEYVPIDSVYAFGEIKSTYYSGRNYLEGFSEVLSKIGSGMVHEHVANTAYRGRFENDTLLRDVYLGKGNKILNKIFSFMLFIDEGDFKFDSVKRHLRGCERRCLPNTTVILNSGAIVYGRVIEGGFSFDRYPDEVVDGGRDWYFIPFAADEIRGSLEGNNLGYLYYSLLLHISNSFLSPPRLDKYLASMMVGKKSLIQACGDL